MTENSLSYVELSRTIVTNEIILDFTCRNSNIDNFFHETAKTWCDMGIGVTYILISSKDLEENKINKIYAFATIACAGLLYTDKDSNKLYMPCAEIKYFAINKAFRGQTNTGFKDGKRYSQIFFKMFLQELYYMSTSIIGFSMIYLQANSEGRQLYEKCNFIELNGYVLPDADEKIEIEECTPMGMPLSDENIGDMFL